jgi:hypothetical protein
MTMLTDIKTPETNPKTVPDALFIFLMGLVLGLMGGVLQRIWIGIAGAVILLAIFSAYNQVLQKNSGIVSGLIAGVVLGTAVGGIGILIGGSIDGLLDGLYFGVGRGALIGAVVGVVTRAKSDENDTQQTKILIFGGSIFLGTILGSVVGIATGTILGIVGDGGYAVLRAAIIGLILGAAIGSYFHEPRWLAVGAFSGALLAALSSLIGGALAGVILGAISGTFAPILLVSGIGAFGGLTSRGLKAMVVEAFEAPTEMLEQGAVPFLAPALIIGAIIGTIAAGSPAILALAITFGLLGMLFGILGEINGAINNRVTMRSMVETTMIGSDSWPILEVVRQITKTDKLAITGVAVGVGLALISSIGGAFLGQLILRLVTGG